jgi:hypothetical protein
LASLIIIYIIAFAFIALRLLRIIDEAVPLRGNKSAYRTFSSHEPDAGPQSTA